MEPHATILLVEDDPAIRRSMSRALERAGYQVLEARNGAEALEVFNANVDLLLTDVRLPHVHGAEVIKQLRRRRQSLKVLAFSGSPTNEVDGVPFLAKPFTRAQLVGAVNNVLA